jgi:SRSO17 transposase
MQRLLNHAVWDEHQAMGIVWDFVLEHLAGPDAVVVLDETGQEKKGTHTAGVAGQYAGCAGRVTNAVTIVYCTYASERGHAQVGARLYLPHAWTTDPERCERAGLDPDVVFHPKPQLAVELLSELDTAGALPPWVTADEGLWPRPGSAGLLRGPRRGLRTRHPLLISGHADFPPSSPR